jgi:hypothetical protein
MNFRNDPVVIAAIGGSGTRVFARIIRHAGLFIGNDLNQQEDSQPFIDFYNIWIPLYIQKLYDHDDGIYQVLKKDFLNGVEQHLCGIDNSNTIWGIKNPKAIHMIPLWHDVFPDMKFIHVVRNGLDIVYSNNQGQFECYKDLIFNRRTENVYSHSGKILFWSRVNRLASEYGETYLKDRYLRIRFEDLCLQPQTVIKKIFEFLEIYDSNKLANAISEVSYKKTINRWKKRPVREIYEIMKAGQPELEYFGYWDSNTWQQIEKAVQLPRLQRLIFQHLKMKHLTPKSS